MRQDGVLKLFGGNIRHILERCSLDLEQTQEIRLRSNKPLIMVHSGKEYLLNATGQIVTSPYQAYTVSQREVNETLSYVANYSIYAYEEELKHGFITVQGGHRVGVAGCVTYEDQKIKGIKYVSCLNVRISHEIKGSATKVLPYLLHNENLCHTLIISAPRCGKTTILRDLIRQLSDGINLSKGYTVGVVDERSEIGGSYMGIPQNDLGIRTDLLDCCPKAEGMMMLIRSMSPMVVAVDELGSYEDIYAIASVVNCGCKLLATVHGTSMEDVLTKPLFQELLKEHVFERYIILGNSNHPGTVKTVFDQKGSCLFGSPLS